MRFEIIHSIISTPFKWRIESCNNSALRRRKREWVRQRKRGRERESVWERCTEMQKKKRC